MIKNEIINLPTPTKGIVIDLDNVLLEDRNKKNKAKFCNIEKIRIKLNESGYNDIICIAGPSLKHKINNVKSFEKSIQNKKILLAPALADPDWYIITSSHMWNYDILSNDKFEEYWTEFGEDWIRNKRKTFMYINGEWIIKI